MAPALKKINHLKKRTPHSAFAFASDLAFKPVKCTGIIRCIQPDSAFKSSSVKFISISRCTIHASFKGFKMKIGQAIT